MKRPILWLLGLFLSLLTGWLSYPASVGAAVPGQGEHPGGACYPATIVLTAADPLVGGTSPRAGAPLTITGPDGPVGDPLSIGNDGKVYFPERLPAGVAYTVAVGDLADLPGYQVQLTPACECRDLPAGYGYVQAYQIGPDGAVREEQGCQAGQACSVTRLAASLFPAETYAGAAYTLRSAQGALVSTGVLSGTAPQEIGRALSGRDYRFVIAGSGSLPEIDQVLRVPCSCDTAGGLLQMHYYWIGAAHATPLDRSCRAGLLPIVLKAATP